MNRCEAIILHSGGMDSSICLAMAAREFGSDHILSLGFSYQQRHTKELEAARKIARYFGVRRFEMEIPVLSGWENSSLIDKELPILNEELPNSFVVGRNGLFLMMAAPLARKLGAKIMYIGVMELEGANSGYPDCSRAYIDSVQKVVRMDIQESEFEIRTPLIEMTKAQTMHTANSLGVLDYLLEQTITCYEGIAGQGCGLCPACLLRADGICRFQRESAAKIAS